MNDNMNKRTHTESVEETRRNQQHLTTLANTGEDSTGLFADGSMIRQMGQEALGLLGAGRAILLQLAHPLIAAGVHDHSDFQADPRIRLFSTLELMHKIVFGRQRQAEEAVRRFHAVHERIQGRLQQTVGIFPAGTTYRANDPYLKLWVMATLVDTNIVAFKQFVGSLTPEQQQHYYEDARALGGLLGIPDGILPSNLEGFQDYMAEMLAGDTLAVNETARQLAWEVLDPDDVGIVSAGSARLLRFTTTGLLPLRLRKAYRLSWDRRRQSLMEVLGRMTRLLRPQSPKWVWQSPLLEGRLARSLLWGMTASMSGSGDSVTLFP